MAVALAKAAEVEDSRFWAQGCSKGLGLMEGKGLRFRGVGVRGLSPVLRRN